MRELVDIAYDIAAAQAQGDGPTHEPKKVQPYLDAMFSDPVLGFYIVWYASGKSCRIMSERELILNFLSCTSSWRGGVARTIRDELNKMERGLANE